MQTKSEMINRIAELAKENAGLKAENDRLKARKDKYYQQTLDDEIKLNELYQTLQEIKAIAETCCSEINCEECPFTDECNTEMEALGVCRMILKSISKAEEE